jgi:uridylate kinase
MKNSNSIHYPELTYRQILTDKLKVMDLAAVALASENALLVAVFSINQPGELLRTLQGDCKFTMIREV